MTSTYVVKAFSSSLQEIIGIDQYIRFCDLKKKEGDAAATLVRDSKRMLQKELEASGDTETLPWVLKHPDLPGNEESCLLILSP